MERPDTESFEERHAASMRHLTSQEHSLKIAALTRDFSRFIERYTAFLDACEAAEAPAELISDQQGSQKSDVPNKPLKPAHDLGEILTLASAIAAIIRALAEFAAGLSRR